MGGVAVLHPQDCLKDHRDNLFSTPVKSRRAPKPNPNFSNSVNSNANFARSDGRKRSPPTGVRKNAKTMVAEPPAVAVAKNLVMGQVKILKRGEALDESTVLKDVNERKASNAAATPATPVRESAADRKVSATVLKDVNERKASNAAATATTTADRKESASDRKGSAAGRRVKKMEKERKSFPHSNSNSSPKIDALKADDFALSSTNRLGPDPEMVPKQMKKNIAEFFFAGSAFVDSPPPSSLPLPGFFTKNFVAAAVKEDASTDLRRMLGLSLS